jgi:formamidopyrimidine-DNA glycosylase
MPELPEVETTRRGISPYLLEQTIESLTIRQVRLRWPIDPDLPRAIHQQQITSVERRGKYLLIGVTKGTLIIHLGMSGSLRITHPEQTPQKHDHFEILLSNGVCLRFHDPRRFGCLLWTPDDPYLHPLLAELGPEPFEANFNGHYLYEQAANRIVPVKLFIMNHRIVVGVGNIYANESLFRAGIDPRRQTRRVALKRYECLAEVIRKVLLASIEQGGTTLRDFVNESGNPGYFQQTLQVYDRQDLPCRQCGTIIRSMRLGQRSSYWCPQCQH